jgi:DNA-binding transcriptional MerR regulator
MGRPAKGSELQFTSRELGQAVGLTARNIGFLQEQRLAPAAIHGDAGRGGHRLYNSAAFAHAALIGALHLAGFELMPAARLAAALADDFASMYGQLHSNLQNQARAHRSLFSGIGAGAALDDDFWIYSRLVDGVDEYKPDLPERGDAILEIADHEFVLTSTFGWKGKTMWMGLKDGVDYVPEYRIVGRGAGVELVSFVDEVGSLDFEEHPENRIHAQDLMHKYLAARENAVALIRLNMSLAIRNAFGRVLKERAPLAA